MASKAQSSANFIAILVAAAENKRLAANTVIGYRRYWEALSNFLLRNHLELAELTSELANKFFHSIADGKGPSFHLQAKASFAFACRHFRVANPFKEVDSPRFDISKVDISYLEGADLGRLIAALDEQQATYFDRAIGTLAYGLFATSCRYHEWATLEMDDFRLVEEGVPKAVRIRSKGGTIREIPLAREAGRRVARWFDYLAKYRGTRLRRGDVQFASSALAFPGAEGNPISNQAFNSRLAKACEKARIRHISAHGLRHSAATLLLGEGYSIREVQEVLGHKNIATTARYTHFTSSRMRQIFESLTPPWGQAGASADSG